MSFGPEFTTRCDSQDPGQYAIPDWKSNVFESADDEDHILLRTRETTKKPNLRGLLIERLPTFNTPYEPHKQGRPSFRSATALISDSSLIPKEKHVPERKCSKSAAMSPRKRYGMKSPRAKTLNVSDRSKSESQIRRLSLTRFDDSALSQLKTRRASNGIVSLLSPSPRESLTPKESNTKILEDQLWKGRILETILELALNADPRTSYNWQEARIGIDIYRFMQNPKGIECVGMDAVKSFEKNESPDNPTVINRCISLFKLLFSYIEHNEDYVLAKHFNEIGAGGEIVQSILETWPEDTRSELLSALAGFHQHPSTVLFHYLKQIASQIELFDEDLFAAPGHNLVQYISNSRAITAVIYHNNSDRMKLGYSMQFRFGPDRDKPWFKVTPDCHFLYNFATNKWSVEAMNLKLEVTPGYENQASIFEKAVKDAQTKRTNTKLHKVEV